jgi:hypothetical protein
MYHMVMAMKIIKLSGKRQNYFETFLRKKYGMTLRDFQDMYEHQDFRCAICGERDRIQDQSKRKRLSIDHDHETGKVRGLLCQRCNVMIGMARDNPDILRRAALYVSPTERYNHKQESDMNEYKYRILGKDVYIRRKDLRAGKRNKQGNVYYDHSVYMVIYAIMACGR